MTRRVLSKRAELPSDVTRSYGTAALAGAGAGLAGLGLTYMFNRGKRDRIRKRLLSNLLLYSTLGAGAGAGLNYAMRYKGDPQDPGVKWYQGLGNSARGFWNEIGEKWGRYKKFYGNRAAEYAEDRAREQLERGSDPEGLWNRAEQTAPALALGGSTAAALGTWAALKGAAGVAATGIGGSTSELAAGVGGALVGVPLAVAGAAAAGVGAGHLINNNTHVADGRTTGDYMRDFAATNGDASGGNWFQRHILAKGLGGLARTMGEGISDMWYPQGDTWLARTGNRAKGLFNFGVAGPKTMYRWVVGTEAENGK